MVSLRHDLTDRVTVFYSALILITDRHCRAKFHGKRTSYALYAICFYLTAVGVDDDFALIQSNANAFTLCGLEWLEQTIVDKFP